MSKAVHLEPPESFGKRLRVGITPVLPTLDKPPDQLSSIFTVPAVSDSQVIQFLIDTGADVSILPSKQFRADNTSAIQKLVSANGQDISTSGTRSLSFRLAGSPKLFSWRFILADTQRAILGSDFLAHEDIKVDCRRNKIFTDSFTMMGSNKASLQATVSTALSSNQTFRIETTGPPIAQRVRKLSNHALRSVRAEFDQLLLQGTIRRSTSPWASPLVLVKKTDGTFRPCGDYRMLNSVTKPDRYPLPRISDILDRISGKAIFTTLDLKKAFHQIPIDAKDIAKTAIVTPFGLFEYTTMPFGLRNAAQMFQRHMDALLHGCRDFACSYIDDIIIFSDNVEHHENHLSTVLNLLAEASMEMNIEKCKFRSPTVRFLGFNISAEGVKPIREKIDNIINMPEPNNIKSLRRFLGAATFYQWMIPNLSQIMAPLHALLTASKGNQKFVYNTSQREAANAIKQKLKEITTMQPFDENKSLILCTDASGIAVGASLNHEINSKLAPIAFFSRKLNNAEKRYSTFDRELLAIYLAVKKFRHYLEGSSFKILTDHKPLLYIQSMKDPSNRQWRHIEFLNQFTFQIQFIKGTENIVADFLSRMDENDENEMEILTLSKSDIIDEQQKEKIILLSGNSFNVRTENGLLIDLTNHKKRIILPVKFRHREFCRLHGMAHVGANKTIDLIRSRYVWPKMKSEIRRWTRECHRCQAYKISRHTKAKLGSLPDRGRFKVVHMDVVGPLPSVDGKRFILTIIDRHTSWPEAIPIHDITAAAVTKAFVSTWIGRFGPPEIVITDQGRQFFSNHFKETCRKFGIEHRHTTPHHPECNGKIERFHRSLKNALKTYSGTAEQSWAHDLPIVLLGLRNSMITGSNASPALILYGSSTYLPGDIILDSENQSTYSKEDIETAIRGFTSPAVNKQLTRKIFVPSALSTCTEVWLRRDIIGSLKSPYEGPYKVLRRSEDMKTFVLDINGQHKTISIDRLKPTFTCQDTPLLPQGHM